MLIRKAQPEDCQFIRDVHCATVTAIRTSLYTAEEIQAWAVPKKLESYQESILTKEFLVAEDENAIIGFAVLNPESSEVEAVYVSPAAEGRGVGRELLRELENRAEVLGLEALRLNASLNAAPFYNKAGYVGAEQSKYRLSTGVEIACIPMVKMIGGKAG